ncbi:MAG: hypothetical protein EZS26_001022 [Candidatus Ordinivivax streblomastigis]|uniref:Uncharacterized protein n=1 Tax=Candidatus Ordinivivax streblomastigis TaxID=2540710 RepID=A0A5M8P3D3_9BACT|nr:MAG: hypothetical protein EZS26_001022 [Candidatus Ordinivivax streblomastigis]
MILNYFHFLIFITSKYFIFAPKFKSKKMKNKKISTCGEVRYREFPEMVFGVSENGSLYFNASKYLLEKGDGKIHSIEGFKTGFNPWIKAVCEGYNLTMEELFMRDETGNWFIEESLSLLFITYLDSGFAIYILERISEMLITGIVLSDTTLMMMTRERLSKDDLIQIIQYNEKK